jgi:Uri superfamily endonuclease
MVNPSPLSYIVLFRCRNGYVRTRGSVFKIDEGIYAYVGSCGNHCGARIMRHLAGDVRTKYWHVDYLHDLCDELAVMVLPYGEGCVARALLSEYEGIPGFGSSDKREDRTHLFRIRSTSENPMRILLLLRKLIKRKLAGKDL